MEKRTKVCALAPLSGIRGEGERSGAEKRSSAVLKGGALAAVALGLMLMKAAPSKAEDADDIVSNGAQPIAYDISPANDGTNIAVGKNAKVFIGGGTQEAMLSFGETVAITYDPFLGIFPTGLNIHSNNVAKQNLPEGIAIGTNSYARTGSIQIGAHTLEKNKIAIGDTTADKLRQFGVASTTLGTNSYTGGGFATTLGSYNVQSSPYEAKDSTDTLTNSTKNAFSTVVGTLNSNESMNISPSSGVANVINGAANKVTNSNGAIVIGAGNSVKESSASFDASAYSKHFDSVTAMQKALMDGVAKSAGGAVLAVGGANAAEYAQSSQMMGVGNKLTGTSGAVSKYNLLDGYKNTAKNVNHVSVIGSENTVENTNTSLLLGDRRKLSGAHRSVVLGSADAEKELKVADAVLIGHNADVQKEGGVALGSGSLADRAAFTTSTKGAFSDFDLNGKTAGAVSVGTADKLRQIINVGDGTQATDAVNVRQLQAVADVAASAAGAANADMYFHVNPGAGVAPVGTNKGPMTATAGAGGANSLAAGINAKTGKDAEKSVAVGYGSYAKEPGAVSIGSGAGGEYGAGISIGDGSVSQRSTSLAIGTGAKTGHGNGPTAGGGDIAVGDQSFVENYVNQGGGIAIGQKSHVENMYGSREKDFAFGQTDYSGGTPADPSKVATGIAIGQNSFARTGSLMVGTHNYRGLLGDVTVDSANTRELNLDINSTTLGTNSYNEGAFSTVTGAYSIASGSYSSKAKNFGANIYGALNSIESETAASPLSGVANSVVGTANRTFNSNGSLVFGAGNEIKNSVAVITGMPTSGGDSAKALADSLRAAVKSSDGGGATLAIGGGNTADWTQASQIIGVNNTLTGTDENNISKYNLLDGYKNTARNVNHVSVIGSENTVENTNTALLLGDRRKLSGAHRSVVLGSADTETTTDKEEVVILGYKANATVSGGVALGSGSVASVDKGAVGYDPTPGADHANDTTGVWKSTAAAVSVGVVINGGATVTRQITGVAAGTNDTDAVNVAQLKALLGAGGGSWNLDTKPGTQPAVAVNPNDTVTFTSGDNITITRDDKNVTIATKADVNFNSVTANTFTAGGASITIVSSIVRKSHPDPCSNDYAASLSDKADIDSSLIYALDVVQSSAYSIR
ncbi:MAG: hypothetical protein SOY64_04535 [Pyramidobacter sp.]|uniref:beta strand repeat-containing protein n=1 Tax=Pyramidobacter sp. TaxID=1943581 RepID=UPI002A806E90|nr:hypothetical protein [Pyramidobacter sp.]MDY4032323.1 hypothetical protein [Pyramidobacter sp.]